MNGGAYYNENNHFVAEWLRNLIRGGHIAAGEVDERSIIDVQSDDLKGYTQCHFFAGIGGWSYALRLAGWSDDRSVWTGSCPCQPFSNAGNKAAQSDERHLWPNWYRLIKQSEVPTIFGEQVASAIAQGWLDDVFHDMENKDYSCAAAVLCAYGVKSPQPRDRIFWVANSNSNLERRGLRQKIITEEKSKRKMGKENRKRLWLLSGGNCEDGDVEVSSSIGPSEQRIGEIIRTTHEDWQADYAVNASETSSVEWVEWPKNRYRPIKSGLRLLANGVSASMGRLSAYGNAIVPQVAAEFIKASEQAMMEYS